MINFNEELHEYRDNRGVKYTSVTQLIGLYGNVFDEVLMAKRCAGRVSSTGNDYRGMTPEQVLQQWKKVREDACDKGNIYHNEKENKDLEEQNLKKGYQKNIDLYNIGVGVKPELRVFLKEFKIAGHIDRPEFFENKSFFIEDYKTNAKEITKQSYKDKKMKKPLQSLPDCSWFHYSLQLNIYAYILDYYGYKCKGLRIKHKRFLDNQEIPEKYFDLKSNISLEQQEKEMKKERLYDIKYRPDIIKVLLNHFKVNNL